MDNEKLWQADWCKKTNSKKEKWCHLLRIFRIEHWRLENRTLSDMLSQWLLTAITNIKWLTTKKISDRKSYEFGTWIRTKQRLHTERNCPKKGSPLEPRYVGIWTIGTKVFQTHTKKGGWYDFFYIKNTQKTILKTRLYELIGWLFILF